MPFATTADVSFPVDSRPGVAIIVNSLPPYRLHVHRRIARELSDIRLWTVLTHEGDGRWPLVAPPEIGPVLFGQGETNSSQTRPGRIVHEWRKGGRITRWMQEHDVKAVVLLGYNDAGRLRVLRWCRRRGVPCFIWGDSNIHDDRAAGLKAIVKRAVLPRVLAWATGAMACGDRGRAYFARYGVPDDRTFISPYEPDYDQITALAPERVAAARARHGLDPARRRIIYSGRLVDIKRVDLLVDAFARLATERPDWDLVIAGHGPLRASLESRVSKELTSRVVWTGHLSDEADVTALYRASDVLVLPSDREPWALVINEAAAAGLAMVSSDAPGASAELVRDGVNGRIFPTGDLDRLTECLRDVTDPAKIDPYKAASAGTLADWRRRGDPIDGLRKALRSVGVPPCGHPHHHERRTPSDPYSGT